MKKFGLLSKKEKDFLRQAAREGRVEVHCDWWPDNCWDRKVRLTKDKKIEPSDDLWDECYYRIIK